MRASVAALLLLVAVGATGCRPQASAPAPTPTATPVSAPTQAVYRVGVVDLRALMRAHRRWPELETLLKKIDGVQLRLTNPPPPPDLPKAALGPDLQAEADRLRASIKAELDELREQLARRVQAYINDLQAETEAKLADRQRELNAELQKAIEARRDELQRDLDRFELATMAEYRLPLANIRVKADVIGVSNEEEGKRLSEEANRIQKERDEKIRVRAQALEQQLQEFVQARNAEAEAKFKSLVTLLEDEGTAKVRTKNAEAEAEFQRVLKQREQAFNEAMEARRKLVVGGADAQVRAAQERYAKQIQAEAARLQGELRALTEQRLRLEDSMIAEIRIEIASLAQERRVDAVLTNAVAHPGALDLTQDVIARLKRS